MKPNWITKKLGEIQERIKKEKAPVGTVPYIEIGNVDVESKKANLTNKGAVKGSVFCPENSILISRVRPTRGAVILLDKKMAVSSAFTIIKPSREINPKLLFYFLAWNKRFFDFLGNKQKGTNYPSVRENDILDFEISLPGDINEQQNIVYVLDSIQEAVRVQEKIIEKTKELKKAMMAKLFREGAPSFSKGRKLKKTEIGEIPEDWKVVKFTDCLERTSKKFQIIKLKQKEFQKSGKYPIVDQGANLISGYINDESKVYKGKLPVIIFGDHTRVLKFVDFRFAIGADGTKLIYPKDDLDIKYFFYALTNINIESRGYNRHYYILKQKLIPLPPLPEQQEIVKILQTVDQKIEIEQKKKALYEELFKIMLNKLMTGEIRVNNI